MHDFFMYLQSGFDSFRRQRLIIGYQNERDGIGHPSNPPHMQISQPRASIGKTGLDCRAYFFNYSGWPRWILPLDAPSPSLPARAAIVIAAARHHSYFASPAFRFGYPVLAFGFNSLSPAGRGLKGLSPAARGLKGRGAPSVRAPSNGRDFL